MFWNIIITKPLGEKRNNFKDEEYNISPLIQEYCTNTKLTTKTMNDKDKSTVYYILRNTSFYSMRHNKGLNSARMKDASNNLPKPVAKFEILFHQ